MAEHPDIHWLDANPEPEAQVIRARPPALGSDPLAESLPSDPFFPEAAELDRLALLGRTLADPLPEATDVVEARGPEPADEQPPSDAHIPRRSRVPSLDEVELPEPVDRIDRLLSDDERRRLAALGHLVEGEFAYDRFGFSPEVLRRATPILTALHRYYFRVESSGHERIPRDGPAILAGNHGGILPFDAAMVGTDLFLRCDPPRLARTIVDRWAGQLPWVNIFYARAGQVIGTRENFKQLLAGGHLVVVFPEGMNGAIKPVTERYQLQTFRVGFIEQALKARVPVIPTAIVGSDDQAPILFDMKAIAKRLGLPVFPITPTFPWLGPLGLLPYPVRYRIEYGEPLHLHERFSPEDARDPELVRFLARQVRRAVQRLIDQHR